MSKKKTINTIFRQAVHPAGKGSRKQYFEDAGITGPFPKKELLKLHKEVTRLTGQLTIGDKILTETEALNNPELYTYVLLLIKKEISEKRLEQKTKELEHEIETLEKQASIAKNPKELAEITGDLFTNVGFKTSDYKGITEIRGGQDALWQVKNLSALVPVEDLHLLEQGRKKKHTKQGYLIPIPPKITVSQAKNIDTLICLLEKKNRQRKIAKLQETGEIEFSFSEYAKIRGYTDSDIKKGGNFNNELKRDLISGGITSYITEKDKSYLIGNLYNIEVPKVKSKGKWKIYFNEPYRSYLLNVKQYYPILLKAIADKRSNEKKGYLYFFIKEVLRMRNNPETGHQGQQKVITLLKRIKVSNYTTDRPEKSYQALAEGIEYIANNYPEELSELRLINPKYKGKPQVFNDLSIFAKTPYKEFKKKYLEPLGVSDIRDPLISFGPGPEINSQAPTETEQEKVEYLEGNFLP